MPIEIKELHIRVSVNVPGNDQSQGNKPSGSTTPGNDKDTIIAECVEQIVQIFQTKAER